MGDRIITVNEVRDFFAWEPVSQPDTYEWNGELRETGQTKWLRSDNGMWLGTRGESAPHGYRQWLVSNMSLLTDSEIEIVNYGELDGGRKAYVQIATEQVESVAGVDYRPMITATSSMDGSFATGYGRNVQVIVCLNTFQMARNESARDGMNYRVKATKNSKFEVLKAREALNIMFDDSSAFAELVREQTGQRVSESDFQRFLNLYTPIPAEKGRAQTMAQNKQSALQELWRSDERVSPWRGTKFGVVQAVNTYETHLSIVRNAERSDRNMLKTMRGEWLDVNAEAERILASVI